MPFGRKRAFLAISLVAAAVVSSAGSAAAGRPALQLRLQHGLEVSSGTETSSNWAGYAVTHRKPFTSVTGKWVQPTATCADLSSTYSAFWVGLGGFITAAVVLVGGIVGAVRALSPGPATAPAPPPV